MLRDFTSNYLITSKVLSIQAKIPVWIACLFDFAPKISRIFGWIVCISVIQKISDFPKTFPGNFRTIGLHFESSIIFG